VVDEVLQPTGVHGEREEGTMPPPPPPSRWSPLSSSQLLEYRK
jgi:hypothetical protein